MFTGVTIGPSPLWLKARLIAAGQRPINNVVDITNYVMLLTAQPLHAFDLDRVPDGELIIRTAADGERMTTLDGVERTFDAEAVLVCDRDGPSGIAGIMGGQASEVSESTTRVLLEVATWNGVNILRTSRKLGLRSEASNRFEKQLHPELAMRAQRVASRLIVELCGAKLVPGTIDAAAEMPPARRARLRAHRAEALLGMRIEPELCATYLERLGFGVEREGDDLVAEVPFHRHYDVSREVDLVEEVGRIHGYDKHLPATLPQARSQGGRLTREQALRRRAEDVMRDLGFDAVVNLSLADPGLPGRLRLGEDDPRRAPIRVSNPLSLEHSELRTTLLGSLLDAARYNVARGAERVALFESGRVYLAKGQSEAGGVLGGEFAGERRPPAFEPHCIAALAAGPARRAELGRGRPTGRLLRAQGRPRGAGGSARGASSRSSRGPQPFLHPGRAARVRLGGLERDGSARSTRSFADSGTSMRRSASRSGLRSWWPDRPSAWSSTRMSPPTRPFIRIWRSWSTRGCRPPGCGRRWWRAAASCCAARRSSTSIAASRWARGARASRCGSSSALLIARSPTPRSPSAARRSRRRSRRSAGRSVSERASAGCRRVAASPARSAAAPGVEAPAPRARRGHLARRGRYAARSPLPAPPRPGRAGAARSRASSRDTTPPWSPIRTAQPRSLSARSGERTCRWSTSRPTSASTTCRPTSAPMAITARRSSCARPSTGSRSFTASRSARRSWSPTPAVTRQRPCWRLRRSPRPGWRTTS